MEGVLEPSIAGKRWSVDDDGFGAHGISMTRRCLLQLTNGAGDSWRPRCVDGRLLVVVCSQLILVRVGNKLKMVLEIKLHLSS